MSFYSVCPRCEANLDPGEKCDCVPVRESTGGKFKLTEKGLAYMKSKAVDGIISFDDSLKAFTELLNKPELGGVIFY